MLKRLWMVLVVLACCVALYGAPEFVRRVNRMAATAAGSAILAEQDRLHWAKYGMSKRDWVMKNLYDTCVNREAAAFRRRTTRDFEPWAIGQKEADYVGIVCDPDKYNSPEITIPIKVGHSAWQTVMVVQYGLATTIIIAFVAGSYFIICWLIPWIIWGKRPR